MYGGALLFLNHTLRNKFRFTKIMPVYIITPYLLMLGAKFLGKKWIDFSMEINGVYDKY
jgi:hypothetical protein